MKSVYVNVSCLPRRVREQMAGALEGVGLGSRKLNMSMLDETQRRLLNDDILNSLDSPPHTYEIAYDLAWRIMYGRLIKVSSGRGGIRNSENYLNELYLKRREYLYTLRLPREIKDETLYLIQRFESWKKGYRPGRKPGYECVKK